MVMETDACPSDWAQRLFLESSLRGFNEEQSDDTMGSVLVLKNDTAHRIVGWRLLMLDKTDTKCHPCCQGIGCEMQGRLAKFVSLRGNAT